MARALKINELMSEIETLELKEEIKLLDLIALNVYKKVNTASSDNQYWLSASERTLKKVWDNEQDEVYNELLER